MASQKTWKIIIVFAFVMFIYSVVTGQIWLTGIALVLGIMANRQNLFKEYDEQQRQKREKYKAVMTEYRQAKVKEKEKVKSKVK